MLLSSPSPVFQGYGQATDRSNRSVQPWTLQDPPAGALDAQSGDFDDGEVDEVPEGGSAGGADVEQLQDASYGYTMEERRRVRRRVDVSRSLVQDDGQQGDFQCTLDDVNHSCTIRRV